MTEGEFAVLIEAWEIERCFPYAERRSQLLALGTRDGAEGIATAVLVEHLVGGGKYEEAEVVAKSMGKDGSSAWSYAAGSCAALAVEGPEVALDLAESALSLDPNNAFALACAYHCAWAGRKYRAAERYIERLATIEPLQEPLVRSYITLVAALGDLNRARELLANSSVVLPGSAASQTIAACFASLESQPWLAAHYATKACELEPHVVWQWLALAEFLLKADRPEEAEEMANRALAINPRDERAISVLVSVARARRDWDAYYLREAALDVCTPYRAAHEHCRAGDRFLSHRELEAAARAYLMSADSIHAGARREARLGLLRVRLRQRDWTRLVPLLSEFESESPAPTIVVLARAADAARVRNWDEAIRLIEGAPAADDDESTTYWHLSYLWQARRLPRLSEVAKAVLAQSDSSEQSAFWALMGLYRANETEFADRHLVDCVERFPASQAIKWIQARRLKATGDKKAAESVWRQLSPQMRRWTPDAFEPSRALTWVREIGWQFRRRLLRG